MDYFTISNGIKVPTVGFGTWQIKNGDEAYNACLMALKAGYRHIDTAFAYGNEESVGRAIRDSGIERDKLFITTKLPAQIKTYSEAKDYLKLSLNNLRLSYVDLYLIHAPWPWNEIGKDCEKGNREVWKAFEEAYEEGLARSIGVSNFSIDNIKNIYSVCKIKPMINQIRYHIGYTEDALVSYCKSENILVEAYSPMGTGRLLNNEKIKRVAEKYHKSVAQICIKFCLQNGTLPLPKASSKPHIENNFDLDFEISGDDLKYLRSLELK